MRAVPAAVVVADNMCGNTKSGHWAPGRCASPQTGYATSSAYDEGMPITGDYEPSTGLPIIVLTTLGNKSGKVRKHALMRVEHDGEYALVASQGGMPTNPSWYYNLKANPTALVIQDGPEPHDYVAREVTGDEKKVWWERSVAAYPPYEEYQAATTRVIPVLVATRAGG
jgi:deazaflavin-dependent oxidoreductase (nitroreductase family)